MCVLHTQLSDFPEFKERVDKEILSSECSLTALDYMVPAAADITKLGIV